MAIEVCVAGATGWTGKAVAAAILEAPDLNLRSAVGRSAAGTDLGDAWGSESIGVPVFGEVADALDKVDVLVDYTSHEAIRGNTLAAISLGAHVVIGASGLDGHDLVEIDKAACDAGVGVFAAGNFSLTAALAQEAALLAAKHLPSWEIIDYGAADKPDAPSGTSRELAERLAAIRKPSVERPITETAGRIEARGATIAGSQIHSLRLPSFELSTEIVFGLPHERLIIRHVSNPDPAQFVEGTLLAVRAVSAFSGVVRGLDKLLLSGD